jgi:hypothetical protein
MRESRFLSYTQLACTTFTSDQIDNHTYPTISDSFSSKHLLSQMWSNLIVPQPILLAVIVIATFAPLLSALRKIIGASNRALWWYMAISERLNV